MVSQVSPDLILHNAAVSACGKGEQWQRALLLFSTLQVDLTPNEITFNAAMSACEKGSQWRIAVELLSRMPERQLLLLGNQMNPKIWVIYPILL